jgi:AbiV family abortive infection protein
VDLRAVKASAQPELAVCAIAAARNAQGLLDDAELLARAGRTGRAYALAVLAVEECGKAMELTALAVMPPRVRARAPLGRMLQWHQLKLVGGLLIAVLPIGTVGSRVAVMSADELAHIARILDAPADEADRLKRRGFYVDMDRSGRVRDPSEITKSELASQLGRARQATASGISLLLGPDVHARLAHPPAGAVELIQELVSALAAAGCDRTPKAAAEVILTSVDRFREHIGGDLAGFSGQVPVAPLEPGGSG